MSIFYTPHYIIKYVNDPKNRVIEPLFEVGVSYYMVSLLHTIQQYLKGDKNDNGNTD